MKHAQLLDRDSEPGLKRSRTFFYADETMAAQERRVRRQDNNFSAFLLAGATVLGIGLVALIDLAPMIRLLLA